MPWSQKRALVQRFLSVCESWGSVATWALSVCLKIPCLVTVHIVSTCHRVNPHGRGQVDGEDERSEGARQVHLKTVSWVVAWNIILSFCCCCCCCCECSISPPKLPLELELFYILTSSLASPSIPKKDYRPKISTLLMIPGKIQAPDPLENIPREHIHWRTSSPSIILTWWSAENSFLGWQVLNGHVKGKSPLILFPSNDECDGQEDCQWFVKENYGKLLTITLVW